MEGGWQGEEYGSKNAGIGTTFLERGKWIGGCEREGGQDFCGVLLEGVEAGFGMGEVEHSGLGKWRGSAREASYGWGLGRGDAQVGICRCL